MTADCAIRANRIGKCYQMYRKPLDRLKQSLWRGRRRYYQEFWALRDVSFEIRKGETVGIIGANGSGKSTLLQLMSGIVQPTEGEIAVNGRVAALLELGAGFNPEFTGKENVYLNGAIMGIRKTEIDSRYEEIVAFADIGDFINQPVKTYSSGMYVRLAFAVAINVLSNILLVDEALSVGDARFQQKCMAKIREFCQAGTVVFVSHDTLAITELCSRVLWIDEGGIRLDGSPKQAVERYLQYMYEGDSTRKIRGTPARRELCEPGAGSGDAQPDYLGGFVPIPAGVHQFGDRRVSIEKVRLLSPLGSNCGVYGEQRCEISMVVHIQSPIKQPIVGYIVKDRLGREIFGDRHTLKPLASGRTYVITFVLNAWPNLLAGDYSIAVAMADGTVEDHVQCHFIHDALIVSSIPTVIPSSGFFAPRDTACEVMDFSAARHSTRTELRSHTL